MAKFSATVRGLNVVFLVFSLLVLAGSAYYLSTNQAVSTKSRASNVIETATGKLVKNGSPQFKKNCSDATAYYALIDTSKCTPLVVNGTIADPLIGKTVTATGVLNDDAFYASSLKPQ